MDYSILRNDVVFRNNTPEVGLDISIDIMHDLFVEGLEVVYLSLTQPVIIGLLSDGAVIGSHQNAIIFIRDDDGLRKYFLWGNIIIIMLQVLYHSGSNPVLQHGTKILREFWRHLCFSPKLSSLSSDQCGIQ